MRKEEILQLHALGVVVRRELAASVDVPDDSFGAYDALDVSPTTIARRKSSHRAAVRRLFDGIDSTIQRQTEEVITSSGPR